MPKNNKNIFIILHNIRSAHNVGSIFRTADAADVAQIFLTGYTPTPTDRFGRARKDIAKTALGAEKTVSWKYVATPTTLIKQLKKDGVFVVAVEQDKNAVDYKGLKIKYPVVFIFGNEVRGLSTSILKQSDVITEIPMHGKKESLNVSVAAGIILFSALQA